MPLVERGGFQNEEEDQESQEEAAPIPTEPQVKKLAGMKNPSFIRPHPQP